MVSFEIIWELLSSELKDTEFWPAIVGSTAIVIALGILLRKIKMIWRKVGSPWTSCGVGRLLPEMAQSSLLSSCGTSFRPFGTVLFGSVFMEPTPPSQRQRAVQTASLCRSTGAFKHCKGGMAFLQAIAGLSETDVFSACQSGKSAESKCVS